VIRENWRNDYGLVVLGNDWSAKPLLRYSCGNI
jgi:hypothetical protein